MASVRKRPWTHNGVTKSKWIVTYTDQAGARRQGGSYETKKEAEAARLHIEKELEKGTHVAKSQTLYVRDLATRYIDFCKKRLLARDGFSTHTLRDYENALNVHIIPRFGSHRLTELRKEDLRDWMLEKAKVQKYNSVAKLRQVFGSMLQFGVEEGFLQQNIFKVYRITIPGTREPIAIPSVAEVGKIIAGLDKRARFEREMIFLQRRAVVALAMLGGLRIGEIAGLHWENVHFETDTVEVRHSLSRYEGVKKPKTLKSNRDIIMAVPVKLALQELCAYLGSPKTGACFVSSTGKRCTTAHIYRVHWTDYLARLGMTDEKNTPAFHLHALRHVNASLLFNQGLSPVHVHSHLGHSNPQVTMQVYAHLLKGDGRVGEAIVALGETHGATWERQISASD